MKIQTHNLDVATVARLLNTVDLAITGYANSGSVEAKAIIDTTELLVDAVIESEAGKRLLESYGGLKSDESAKALGQFAAAILIGMTAVTMINHEQQERNETLFRDIENQLREALGLN